MSGTTKGIVTGSQAALGARQAWTQDKRSRSIIVSDLGSLVTVEYHMFEDWQQPLDRIQSLVGDGYHLVTIHKYLMSLYNIAYLQKNGNGDAKSR